MAPKLPCRYKTQVRLGRDGDIEEWLATDDSLDRPVLIRILDSTADNRRRENFLASIRAAAAAHHVGLSEIYAIGSIDNPYSVIEWHGGVSLEDRLRAGDTLSVSNFLEQGPTLAAALATLHQSGTIHGAIDAGAIGFSGNQPAKLSSFGRPPRYERTEADTAALASAMRTAITGRDIPGIRPSQIAEGLPHAVDTILSDAESGSLNAESLAIQLRSLPSVRTSSSKTSWSWRWSILSGVLIVLSLAIAVIGNAIEVNPDSPFLFPVVPNASAEKALHPVTPTLTPNARAYSSEAVPLFPTGDDFPNSNYLNFINDDSRSTVWATPLYFTPFTSANNRLVVAFIVESSPRHIEIFGTPGTQYEMAWAESISDPEKSWKIFWSGKLLAGTNIVRVPTRENGVWLFKITDLPEDGNGRYMAQVGMIRFLP